MDSFYVTPDVRMQLTNTHLGGTHA